ncbi:MAG: prepilin-type N-terminal cleavage/methylation domain-containing protein [Planctomycetota bacterium]
MERGFTLFEVLSAMAIFLLGIVGILSLLTAAISLHKEALDRSIAAMAADEAIARIQALAADELPRDPKTGILLPLAEQPLPGYKNTTYSVAFTESTLLEEGAPVQARIVIAWKSRGQRRVAEFFTFVTPGRSFAEEVRRSRRK